MKNEIEVEFGIVPSSHGSFEGAIEASRRRLDLLKDQVSLINGQTFCGYAFNGSDLSMEFDNGKYALITISRNTIDLDVVDERPNYTDQVVTDEVSFILPGGAKTSWTTVGVLNSLLKEKLVIAPSDQYLFMYKPRGIEYMFDYVVNADTRYLCLGQV